MAQAPESPAPTGLVAFLLTDVEGSTRLWQRHPDLMPDVIARHDRILSAGIEANHGRVLTERGEGDSFFAVFGRASQALAAARDIQRALHAEPWPEETPVRVRMAINTGEAGGDYRGMEANRSARIRQLAHGGQVLISQSTQMMIRDHLPQGTVLLELGLHALRDVDQPERVFEARITGLPAPGAEAPPRRPRPWLPLVALVPVLGVIVFAAVALRPAPAGPTSRTQSHLPNLIAIADRRIITVAGNGAEGYVPGLTRGTDNELDHPQGLAVDPAGDLFISDTNNNRVRELQVNGQLLDVAGGGATFSASGQGGLDIRLDHPTGLYYDAAAHDLYIADTGDNRVLRLDADGRIWLVAGTGSAARSPAIGPAGTTALNAPTAVMDTFIGQDAAGNNVTAVLIVNSGNGSLQGITQGTVGTITGFAAPIAPGGLPGLCQAYSGGLPFLSDTNGNHVFYGGSTVGPQLGIFAGTGARGFAGDGGAPSSAALNHPEGIAVDGSVGDLLVADTGNDVIREIHDGKIITVAGTPTIAGFSGDGGSAGQAELDGAAAVAVDGKGDIFIADTLNNRIREILAPS